MGLKPGDVSSSSFTKVASESDPSPSGMFAEHWVNWMRHTTNALACDWRTGRMPHHEPYSAFSIWRCWGFSQSSQVVQTADETALHCTDVMVMEVRRTEIGGDCAKGITTWRDRHTRGWPIHKPSSLSVEQCLHGEMISMKCGLKVKTALTVLQGTIIFVPLINRCRAEILFPLG